MKTMKKFGAWLKLFGAITFGITTTVVYVKTMVKN